MALEKLFQKLGGWIFGVLLVPLGIAVAVFGVFLVAGELVQNGGFLIRESLKFDALQFDIALAGTGFAMMAVALATRAFLAQRKELQLAEEEIKELRKTPHLEIKWHAITEADLKTEEDLLIADIKPTNTSHNDDLKLIFDIRNIGTRMASIYEIKICVPVELSDLVYGVEQTNIKDGASLSLIWQIETLLPEGRYYSWLIANERDFVLVPNMTMAKPLLRIRRLETGPLQNFPANHAVWNHEHLIKVSVNGDWGAQAPVTLRLSLSRNSARL